VLRSISYIRVCLALTCFLVFAGTAYGAAQLARNSVKTRNLAPSAVTTAKVRDGSLARRDLGTALRAELTAAGPRGPQGEPGAAGAAGARGPAGEDGFGPVYRWVASDAGANGSSGPCCHFFGVIKDGTGRYEVNFYEELEGCGFAATIGQRSYPPASGPIPPGLIGFHRTTPQSDLIRVSTYGADGMPADRSFMLTVLC
jgi:hypothetical protein